MTAELLEHFILMDLQIHFASEENFIGHQLHCYIAMSLLAKH